MHESLILDAIEKVTGNSLTEAEKSILVADIHSDFMNKRFAGTLPGVIMQKLDAMADGMYKEAQAISKTFQDFSESAGNPKPLEIQNMDQIDKFLEKMMSKENTDEFFGDTWEFYHPTENMVADGAPRHRSDFTVKT